MPMDVFNNFAYSGVQVPPTPANLGTSITVYPGTSNRFPAPPFSVSIWPIGLPADPTNAEIVRVTAVVGDIWQIVRQQENSSPRTIEVNDQIAQAMTVKTINDLKGDMVGYVNTRATVLYGLRGAKPASAPSGTLYYEQDTRCWYLWAGAWFYTHGVMPAAFAVRPGGLNANDTGFQWFCTDYGHLLYWTGSDWIWGPGEPGSGYFADFGTPQDETKWAYCDGKTVTILKIGPLREESEVVPFVNGGFYRVGAGAYAIYNALNNIVVPAHAHGGAVIESTKPTDGVQNATVAGHAVGGGTIEIWHQHQHAAPHWHGIPTQAAIATTGEYHPPRLACLVYMRR